MAHTVAELWKKGWDEANKPGRWVRVKHSAFVHRHKKPDQALKNVVIAAVEAIPVPVVGAVVEMVVNEVVERFKRYRRSRKLKSYGSGADLQKNVKHQIKNLDLQELDRARQKVAGAAATLNKRFADGKWIDDQNVCHHILDMTHSFHYLDKRLELLDARAAVFEEVARKTREWCKSVRDSMEDRKERCDTRIEQLTKVNRLFHENCDSKICIGLPPSPPRR